MGEHRSNPTAAAAANGAFRPQPGEEYCGFLQRAELELNKDKLAEAVAIIDGAKARGEDPRIATPRWNPKDNPEFFDYVVYDYVTVARPSMLSLRADQVPTATLRWREHLRAPLNEVRQRADEAFASAESRGSEH